MNRILMLVRSCWIHPGVGSANVKCLFLHPVIAEGSDRFGCARGHVQHMGFGLKICRELKYGRLMVRCSKYTVSDTDFK